MLAEVVIVLVYVCVCLCVALLIAAACASIVLASKCPAGSYPKCEQGSFDIEAYGGVWYTQKQSKSFFFGSGCFCETANYTLLANGTVQVDNKCRQGSISAPLTGNIGNAVQTNKTSPCDLSVTFPPSPVGAPYDVIRTDYKTYTIIASCLGSIGRTLGIDDVWILTRSPVRNDTLINGIVSELTGYGFELNDFEDIVQEGCPSEY